MIRKYHYDMPKVAPKQASELAIQAACKMRVETQFDATFMAIPNGTHTASIYARARRKKEGAVKGAPDAVIIGGMKNPGKVAFAEIKAGGSLSDDQSIMLADLARASHDVGVFRSQDTLAAKLIEWGWQ
jgi:hypothetical protein